MRYRKPAVTSSGSWLLRREFASKLMTGDRAKQRSAARVFVRLPAWIDLQTRLDEHVAFVRDISPRGIFFYSDFIVPAGDRIDFVLQYLSGSNKVRLHLNGKVVRLEQMEKSTTGIAVAFDAIYEDVSRLVRSGPKR
jgi:hypothetical protein